MESWNHSFKIEVVYDEHFKLDQMPSVKRSNILKCITYYNRKRLHSKLGYINPMLIMITCMK